jgi:hypothetical protein
MMCTLWDLREICKLTWDRFFDSQAPLELYDSFAKSPVLKHFTFSPTVLSLLNTILPELSPESNLYDVEKIGGPAVNDEMYRTRMMRHVLAIHLRRGKDWETICEEKGHRSA